MKMIERFDVIVVGRVIPQIEKICEKATTPCVK